MTAYLIIAFSFTIAVYSIMRRKGEGKTFSGRLFLLLFFAPLCGLTWPIWLGFLLRDLGELNSKP